MIPAFLVHISFSACTALLLSFAFGRLTPVISGISIIAGTLVSIRVYGLFSVYGEKKSFSIETTWQKALYVFLLYIAFRHFEYVFFYANKCWRTLNGNNLADLPLHLTYIRYFSGGCSFWPSNPYFSSETLRYPFGMDLYSALFESIGMHTNSHLFLIGILSFIATLIIVHQWLGWWGVGALFLNGGCAGWVFLQTGVLQEFQADLQWKNFFLTMFVPQRGFLFAFPAGLYLLHVFFDICYKEKEIHEKLTMVIGFLWGILAFFSLHSFVSISLLAGSWALVTGSYRKFVKPLHVAFPVALFFIVISTDMFQKAGILHVKWGWMAEDQNIFVFWWRNMGLWMLLPIWIGYEVWKGALVQYRSFYITVVFWFFIYTFIMFAPWEWDNLKMMIWPYLCFCILLKEASEKRIPRKFEVVPAAILLFTGVISLTWSVGSTQKGSLLYRASDVNRARHIADMVSKDAVFATVPTYDHPVSYWGKAIAVGYEGHMWTHGISSSENAEHLNKIMLGHRNWRQSAQRLGITHIYWGPDEVRKYGNLNQPWKSVLPNISKTKTVQVYRFSHSDSQ